MAALSHTGRSDSSGSSHINGRNGRDSKCRSALDYRNGWSRVPLGLIILGDLLVALGFWFIMTVYRANTFTAATVQVAQNQTVISTGPYAIVRHPMYASGLLYMLGTPLALGSWWGLLAVAAFVPVLIWRLLDEESMLAADLKGYEEYRRRVRYRLVPNVLWQDRTPAAPGDRARSIDARVVPGSTRRPPVEPGIVDADLRPWPTGAWFFQLPRTSPNVVSSRRSSNRTRSLCRERSVLVSETLRIGNGHSQ